MERISLSKSVFLERMNLSKPIFLEKMNLSMFVYKSAEGENFVNLSSSGK